MASKESKEGSHKFFSLPTRGKKNRVRKGLAEALGAIGLKPEDDDTSSLSSNSSLHISHKKSRDSLNMSLFDHLKKHKQHDSASEKRESTPHQPPHTAEKTVPIPRITTTAAPSIVSRELLKPQMSRPSFQDRSVSMTSTASVDSQSTIAPEEPQHSSSNRNSTHILDRAKSALMARSKVPSPPASSVGNSQIQVASRGNHTAVTDAVRILRAKLQVELKGSKEEELAAGVSSESFFGFIANERLRRMPAKGSRWDKILKWAEDFAKKLSLFEVTDDSFIPSSKEAVELILACLQLLLLLGPIQGEALERAFGIFHEYGLVFDFYKRNISLLVSISEARRYLSLSLADMLGLSVEMTMLYRKSARAMSTNNQVTVNFNITFGHQMASFIEHKDLISELMWTWQLNNSPEITDIHVSIESIRQWLLPQDQMLRASVTGRRASGTVRAEFTCEWLDRPLVDFARSHDKMLVISAEPGAGKSFLFGWILERLQRRLGHVEYQAIQASIDSQIPSQATQISLVKSLLLQLLTQNVGNVALFRCLANMTELGANTETTHDAEDALWFTLDTALKGLENVVLVIDGLDALDGDEAHKIEAFEHLYDIASKNKNVRVIILTRPFSKPWPKPTRQLTMSAQRTTADVKHMARAYLTTRGLGSKAEIETAVDLIALRSKGSITWADMVLRLLTKVTTITEVTTTIKELPTTTKEILQRHVSAIDLKGDARLILSWLLVSHRPLSTVEIQALLELNVEKISHQSRPSNIVDDIKKACGSLVIIQDKTVRFRNESIRLYLLELSKQEGSKVLMSPAEANKDLTGRLCLYVTICLTRNVESSLEPMSSREVDALFKSHALLEYATRNWLSHFQKSSYYANGQIQPSVSELKGVFPRSTLLARLEHKCWDKQTLAINANAQHLLALRIRQQTLGESSQGVLQGSINVGQSFKKLNASAEASKYFYQAAKIGQTVLGRTSDLAVACANASLEIAATVKEKATARNEAVTQKEELIKYVIENEKHKYGANGAHSALASKLNNELAELYSDIKENDKAESVYREVYQASIAQNGQFSAEAAAAAEKLQAVLYKEAKHEDVVQYTQPIFENAERSLDIFDVRRVEITLRMADTYEKKKDLVRAEELYISLWRGLTEYCRNTASSSTATATTISEAHQRKVQISISYARFLRRQGRDAEAQNILLGVWLDYEHSTENKSEALVKQLSEVGEELKSMGIFETAIAVFKSVWGYFKGAGKQTSAEAVSTAVSLMGAVQEKSEKKQVEVEKAKTAAKANGGIHVDVHVDADIDSEEDEGDEEADAILDEIVKAAVSTPVAGSVGTVAAGTRAKEVAVVVTIESQIATCETLSSFYINKKQWNECVDICAQLLKQVWPDLGVPSKYGFPKAHSSEAVKFARRLALAYQQSNQTEQAEKIYVAIFQSSLRSGGIKIQDEIVTESANQLIEFHRQTQQWAKVLAVYQQLLDGYRTSLGARNALTIKTLFIMGDLCVKYRLKGADRYYLELTKANKSVDGILSKDTLPAAIALSKIYHEQKRWVEARAIYHSVWVTFVHRAKEYNMSAELVQTIYKRYVTVLETHLKVHIDEIHRIAVEYHDTCTRVYGAQAEITMSSSLALVAISRKSSNAMHQEQAVKICEEVVAQAEKQKAAEAAAVGKDGKAVAVAKKQSAFELSLLASAKRHLAALYTVQTHTYANAVVGTKPVVTAEATQKAETLWKEQLEVNKKEHGIAHKSTLASLAALVGVWARSEKTEQHIEAQKKLDVSVVEVLSESCAAGSKTGGDSTKMHEAATSLAKTYLSCGFSVQAWALLKQLRFHVVARGKIAASLTAAAGADKTAPVATVQLPENIDRRSMVFIAAFEETLRQETQPGAAGKIKVTFSDIMTDLLSEGILYDRYSLSIAAKDATVEQKLFDGARLYVFLKTNNAKQHAEQILTVEESLFKLFMDKYGAALKIEASTARAFLVAIIEELGLLRHHEENLVLIACTAGAARAHALLHAGSYTQAVIMATAWHQFMVSHEGFKNSKTIPVAFKLSLYLAGLGIKTPTTKTGATDAALQARMLELSKVVLRETLVACKTMNIDLVQLQASELNSLVRLMGQQKNYEDLEWLLTQLWNSRIIQSSWSSTTVISVGRCLVEVLFVRGKTEAAITLAQAMAYNLRRTCGLLDSQTVEMNNLVSSLCVANRQYEEASDLHEEILRALLDLNFSKNGEHGDADSDADNDDTASELQFDGTDDNALDEEAAAALALQQLELIRRVYARNGGWPSCDGDSPEDAEAMNNLTAAVVAEFAPYAPSAFAAFGDGDAAKWSRSAPGPNDTVGTFVAPTVWEFSTEQQLSEAEQQAKVAFFRRPSYMLRSLRISRQRSYGDLSEARKREASVDRRSWKSGSMVLTAPVH